MPAAVPPAAERERRQVTVLFADVVGFTPLSERFDPEIVHEMMDGCLALLTREVERYGGRVNAFTGDGVMAGELAVRKAPTLAETVWSKTFLAAAWCRMGQAERAVETLVPLVPLYDATQMAPGQILCACFLGEAYCRTGRPKEAAETLEGAIEHAERTGWRYYLGSALRLRAEVARKADPTEPGRLCASAYFEQAIGVLSEIGAENELALAQAGYARLCRESGDNDTARQYYITALETLERLGSLAEPPVIRKALADLNEAAS